MTQQFRRVALVSVAIAIVGCLAALNAIAAPNATPRDASATTQKGTELVEKFFDLIKDGDADGLAKFLSPAFQLQRADGSFVTKDEYVADPAKVESYEIDNLQATKAGNVIVVRYDVVADVTIDGVQQSQDPAPRLSVFAKGKKGYQIVAHANFNVPEETTPTTASPTTEPPE